MGFVYGIDPRRACYRSRGGAPPHQGYLLNLFWVLQPRSRLQTARGRRNCAVHLTRRSIGSAPVALVMGASAAFTSA